VSEPPVSPSDRLRGLLAVSSLIRSDDDPRTLLQQIVRTVSQSLGFGVVLVNLYRPQWDDFRVEAIHGGEQALEALIGDVRGWDTWRPILDQRFERRGAYFVPHGTLDWDRVAPDAYIPDMPRRETPGTWHPEDMLVVPLHHSDGHVLGILGADEPASGLAPTDDELDVLVAFAAHAALAVQSAQEAASARRHRAALEHLLQISSKITETFSIEEILQSVCDGIHAALDFKRVAVDLPHPDTGYLVSRAATGWKLDDPSMNVPMSVAELRPLMDPAFEVEGCFLVPSKEARSRVAQQHHGQVSELNGRGPNAWYDHWLLVPLYARSGEISGVIWADDPGDRMIPSEQVLQSLRVFANQAMTALDAAAQFEEMRFLADHDPLTRLFNRRVFSQRLIAESARFARYQRPFSLVVSDLDGFKGLNDTRGHLAGDRALEAFAQLLQDGRREVDGVYRIGGDEFALVLPEAADEEAAAVTERLRTALATSTDERLAGLGASFGVASCPRDGDDPDDLFRRADQSMYAHKAPGRSTSGSSAT
jgi:diguanylate cyclase (GGDEF)-like protein